MAQIKTLEELRRVLPQPRELTKAKVTTALDEDAMAFIAKSPFALMATAGADGALEVSPKGDGPGFVEIEDARTLLMPERAGNNLAYGLQNIMANGQVALIFLVPQTGETLRVSGTATIHDDADLLARLGSRERPALLAIRIDIARCFFHCARSLIRGRLWQPESWPAPGRISFGRILAARTGGGPDLAREIDERAERYYTSKLYENE